MRDEDFPGLAPGVGGRAVPSPPSHGGGTRVGSGHAISGNAVGVRIDEVPITPEKVFKALRRKQKGEEPRFGPARFPDLPWPEPTRVPPPWEGGDGKAVPPTPGVSPGSHGAGTPGLAPGVSGAPNPQR